MSESIPAITVSALLRSAWRRKFRFAFSFLCVFALVVGGSTFLAKSYHSEAKLLVRLGSENATLDHTATMSPDPVVSIPQSRDDELNSVVDLLHSRGLAEKVVDSLGVDYILSNDSSKNELSTSGSTTRAVASGASSESKAEVLADKGKRIQQSAARNDLFAQAKAFLRKIEGKPPVSAPQASAISELLASYSVTAVHHSNVVQIDCKGPSPEWSQIVVGRIIEAYIDEHIRLNQSAGSLSFFTEQAERAQKDLRDKQNALRDLKVASGMISPNEQRQSLVTRMGRLQDELMQAEAALKVSQTRLDALRKQLTLLPAEQIDSSVTGIGNLGADTMRSQLYLLEVKQEEAVSKYTPDHPILQALNDQIRASRAVVDRESSTRTQVTHGKNKLYLETQSAILQEEPLLAATATRRNALVSQIADVKHEMEAFDQSELKVARLEQAVAAAQIIFQKYDANKERARIDGERSSQRLSNISVAQAANIEPDPVFPKFMQVLGTAGALALVVSLAIAWRADRKDRRFRVPADIEHRLGMPLAGAIPRMRGHSKIAVSSSAGS